MRTPDATIDLRYRRGELLVERVEAFLGSFARVLIRAGASENVIADLCDAASDLQKGRGL